MQRILADIFGRWKPYHAWVLSLGVDGSGRYWIRRKGTPLPPFQSLSGHCVYAITRYQRLKQAGFRSHDPNLAFGNLDALGERAEVVAAIAAAFSADTLTRGLR